MSLSLTTKHSWEKLWSPSKSKPLFIELVKLSRRKQTYSPSTKSSKNGPRGHGRVKLWVRWWISGKINMRDAKHATLWLIYSMLVTLWLFTNNWKLKGKIEWRKSLYLDLSVSGSTRESYSNSVSEETLALNCKRSWLSEIISTTNKT